MNVLVLGNRAEWLSSMEAELRGAYPQCGVASFQDPLLAIQHAVAHPVDMAISERRLKVMDGVAFLRKLRERFPSVVPVLVLDGEQQPAPFPGCVCVAAPATADKLREKVNIL